MHVRLLSIISRSKSTVLLRKICAFVLVSMAATQTPDSTTDMPDVQSPDPEKSGEYQVLPSGGDASPVDLEEKRASVVSTSVVARKILEHSHDADEAMKAFSSGEVVELDEATSKRLLRIIDWHLMPVMCIVYGLNFLDKTTLSYASIMGLKKDTHLVGDDYQWLGSMFYFGQSSLSDTSHALPQNASRTWDSPQDQSIRTPLLSPPF